MADDIVITGMAALACLGLDRESIWAAVAQGRCGMGPLTALESPLPPGAEGGQAPDLPAAWYPDQPREVRYLRRAIVDALRDAQFTEPAAEENNPPSAAQPTRRRGLMLGTTLHGMRGGGQYLRSGNLQALRSFLAAATAQQAGAELGLDAFSATTCSACSSSLGSIALGVTLLATGQLDVVVAGGYDAISEYVYAGFSSLRLVAPGPLRPFTRGRQGMKIAEGYGVVVLERAADAAARRAPVRARILGCGESADAHHLTQPHPQGNGAAAAMTAALRDAGLTPQDIDLICAHATGTPDNDAGEYAALARVFGERLSSTAAVAFKSHLGHTLGGAGAVELILAAAAMRAGVAPPTANINPADLEFPLRLGSAPEVRPIRATLNTSLGFGGANTCIVLGAADGPRRSARVDEGREVLITGIGVLLPGLTGLAALSQGLTQQTPLTQDPGAIPEEQYVHLLHARRIRRMSDYSKLSLAATTLACTDAAITDVSAFAADCPAILGTAHGSTNYCVAYYQQIVQEGMAAANPLLFAEGVPNGAAAQLSLMLGLKGACQTIIGSSTAGLDALRLAALRIRNGQWERAIVGAAEEYATVVNAAYISCGSLNAQVKVGAGAVTFILESRAALEQRGGGQARGRVLVSAGSVGRPRGAAAVLADMGNPAYVICSGHGAADRLAGLDGVFSSLSGHIGECFSVMPMAGLAAVLGDGRLPRPYGPLPRGIRAAQGQEKVDSFAVLAHDCTGLCSGVRIACL